MTTPRIEELVEEFEKKFVNTEYVIGTNKKAYQEWKYGEDAEEAIDWLRTILLTERQRAEGEKAELVREIMELRPEHQSNHHTYNDGKRDLVDDIKAIATRNDIQV